MDLWRTCSSSTSHPTPSSMSRVRKAEVFCLFVFLKPGLWIWIGSGFNDFVDPDSESGSMDKKIKKKVHFP
jgi:hypothetical protein